MKRAGMTGTAVLLLVLLGTLTTDKDGRYYFPQLDTKSGGNPPQYFVVVSADNFSIGGALEGFDFGTQVGVAGELVVELVEEGLGLDVLLEGLVEGGVDTEPGACRPVAGRE